MTRTRKRSELEQLRRGMYKGQRGIGDVQALTRSPSSYVKRRARRYVTRSLFNLFR